MVMISDGARRVQRGRRDAIAVSVLLASAMPVFEPLPFMPPMLLSPLGTPVDNPCGLAFGAVDAARDLHIDPCRNPDEGFDRMLQMAGAILADGFVSGFGRGLGFTGQIVHMAVAVEIQDIMGRKPHVDRQSVV